MALGYYSAGGFGGILDNIQGTLRRNVQGIATTASGFPILNQVPYPVLVAAAWLGVAYVGYKGLKALKVV